MDRYTFEATAGQFFNVFVEQGVGSTLEGDLRVFAPDNTEIHMSSFASLPTSFALLVVQPGTYTIEIDGTLNEPGTYRLVAGFSESYELSLPGFVDENIQPGHAQVFLVSATAGDWFSVNYLRRESVASGTVGLLRMRAPSNAIVFEQNFAAIAFDTGLIQAPS